MTTIQKIETVAYAISKRIQGYHLLQNPKGASQLEVNMIKTNNNKINKQGDIINIYTQIKRFVNSLGKKEEQSGCLMVERYYDHNSKTYLKEKYSFLVLENPRKYVERESLDCKILAKRPKLRKSEYVELVCQHSKDNDYSKKPNFFKTLYRNLTNK